jgi:superoxide dismutase, Cu-Zn family
MHHRSNVIVALATACLAGAATVQGQAPTGTHHEHGAQMRATAELKNSDGQVIGRARLAETPQGVLLTLNVERAPAGEHAFHVHEFGKCDPPTFESAGDHHNPSKAQHGFLDPKGAHAGDLPNIHVPSSGQLSLEYLVHGVTLKAGANSLLDQDGSALVLHAKPDDYRTDPSGAAGDRLACGVIQQQ